MPLCVAPPLVAASDWDGNEIPKGLSNESSLCQDCPTSLPIPYRWVPPPPNPCLVKIMILVVSPSYHTILSLTYRSCDHWRQYLYADVDQIRLVSIQWHWGMSSHIHVQVCSSVLICCPHTHTEHPDPSAGRDHVWLQCSTGHKSWAALRWTRGKGCLWENGQTLWMGEIAPLRVHLAELACVLDSPSNLLLHCLKKGHILPPAFISISANYMVGNRFFYNFSWLELDVIPVILVSVQTSCISELIFSRVRL